MTVIWATFKRELKGHLFSPVAYVILVLLYLFRGIEIGSLVQHAAAAGIDREQFSTFYLLVPSSLIMMILVPPVLTMRCFAEEKRSGSLEVLVTAPVRDPEIVLGKWLAAATFFVLLWLPTLLTLFILGDSHFLGVALAIGPVMSGYLGILLVGGLLLAAGCFTSSLTDNQLLASLMGMLFAALLLFLPGYLAPHLAEQGMVRAAVTEVGPMQEGWWFIRDQLLLPLVRQIDVFDHLNNWFFRGLINTSQVVFYVAGIVAFLFLTTRSLEVRRWR